MILAGGSDVLGPEARTSGILGSRERHAVARPITRASRASPNSPRSADVVPFMEVLASVAVVAWIASGVFLIVWGARERRAAPRQVRERTGVGRIAIGISLLGVVLLAAVVGILWFVGEAFGSLASV